MGRLLSKGVYILFVIYLIGLSQSKSIRRRQDVSMWNLPFMRGGFNRAAVEKSPSEESHISYLKNINIGDDSEYGSKRLPLRAAVESIPPKYLRMEQPRERLPIRDAVERRPPAYDDDLFVLTDELESLGIDPWATDKKNSPPPDKIQMAPQKDDSMHHYVIQLPSSEREQYSQLNTQNVRRGGPSYKYEYYGAAKPYNSDFAWIHNYAAYEPQYSGPLDRYRIDNAYQQIVKSARHQVFDDNVDVDVTDNRARHLRLNSNVKQPLVVCYAEGWTSYRKSPFSFSVASLPPICSHLLYAFATLHPETFTLMTNDREYDIIQGGYRTAVGLKRHQPELRVLISVGGDRWASARRLSQLASSSVRRADFIRSAIEFCKHHGFDGVDIHWQYPGAEDFGGNSEDKNNLVLLLKEMKEAFDPENLIVSIAVPPSRFRIEDGYNATAISEYVEWITIEGFDLRADKESCSVADHHAPLWPRPRDNSGTDHFYNVDYSVRYWLKQGMPASKIVLGVPMFGRSYKLENAINNLPGSRALGPGDEGQYTQTKGMLAYFEICDMELDDWSQKRDEVGSPYITRGDQWIGYDDKDSIINKMVYVKKMGLAGGAAWAVDMDDFRGLCGKPWPLLTTLSNTLKERPMAEDVGRVKAIGSCDEFDDAFVSDPKNCASYFMCRRGIKYRLKCHEGTLYDSETSICRVMDPSMCTPGYNLKNTFDVNYDAYEMKDVNQQYYQFRETKKKKKRIFCYTTNWSFYRKGDGKFVPEHLDTRLCTDVVYAYASLDPVKLIAKEFDPWADLDNNLYDRVTSLHDVRVLLGLGGWTDSSGDKYSKLVSSGSSRRNFIVNLIAFLRRHNFKGLQLDWNYPKCWQSNCAKGPDSDKSNFAKLVQELSEEFKQQTPQLILGVAISGYREVIDVAYDLPTISMYADYMPVMTYDYHGGWESTVSHGSPLYSRPGDKYPQYSGDFVIKHLISKGVSRDKLLFGIAFYGQSFRLGGTSRATAPGSSAVGPGNPGEFTKQSGMLAYYEICYKVKNLRWQTGVQSGAGAYAYNGDQWVGYDDQTSVTEKVNYAKTQDLGGVVAWTVDLDDFSNTCCAEPFPLLRAINRALGRNTPEPPSIACEKPSPPVTPPPPITTTTFESGASSSTTSWTQPTTTTSPWWTQDKTTTTSTTTTTTTARATTTTTPWWTTTTTTVRPTTSESFPVFTTTPAPSGGTGGQCEAGSYMSDPGSCTTYLICSGGERRRQQCAPGLHWNSNAKLCDWPSSAKCSISEGTTSTPASFGMPSTMTTQKTTTTTMRTTHQEMMTKPTRPPSNHHHHHDSTKKPPKMPCINGNYYTHEKCNKFNICVNGILISQDCAPGSSWNDAEGMCDFSNRVKCGSKNAGFKEAITKDAPCQDGQFSVVPGDCTKYKICQWGEFQIFSCAPGLHWNKERNICDWPSSANCNKHTGADEFVTSNPAEISTSTTTLLPTIDWNPTTTTTTTTTTTESISNNVEPLSGYYKIVCYFTNWAWYRTGVGKYVPEDINPNLCTHIVYGFAVLDYEQLVIKAHDSWADFDNRFYERVTEFKKKGLKVLLALGGWNDSAGDKYSKLVNNAAARARFINHALEFLQKHNFDGLDLDWEYPKCWQTDCSKGPDTDKAAFTAWVRELSVAFKPKNLLLSSAVSASKTIIDAGYDVKELSDYMDWIAVMAYDFHGQWDKKTGHVAPLYYHPDDDNKYFNADYAIRYWMSSGAPSRKLVLGMPMYGQSFTLGTSWDTPPALLANKDGHGLNVPARSGGQAGEYTRSSGFLAYYEICDRINNRQWTVEKDEEGRMGPHAYKDDQWVSYDDVETIIQKSKYLKKLNLGGAMIWALDLDDFRNNCGGGKHPLLNAIRDELKGGPSSQHSDEMAPPVWTMPVEKPTVKPIEMKPEKPPIEPVVEEEEQIGGIGGENENQGVFSDESNSYKMICYFTNWAWYRLDKGKYLPSDIDTSLCTHILYGFAVLDTQNLIVKSHDPWADIDNKFYEKVVALKSKGVKVLLALGGWNDSAGDKYSRLVNSPSARRRFIIHIVDFLIQYNFDGLDLDWEYPVCWQVECDKGPSSDKDGFSALVKELREAFTPKKLLLSAAVSPNRKVIDAGYDVPVLSDNLDWIAVMTYDYHGQWDKKTGHVAPMYEHPDDADKFFNANATIHHWIARGAAPSKLVMGLSLYGQSFSLASSDKNGLNAETYGGGEAGDYTRARGFLSYYEICDRVQRKGWTVVRDPRGRMGPYAFKGDQWVSFDDIAMIKHKCLYAKAMGLAGGMVWALDLDDFKNDCGCEKYPLLSAAAREFELINTPQPKCQLDDPSSIMTTTTTTSTTTISTPFQDPVVVTQKPSIQPSKDPIMGETCKGRIFASNPNDCNKYYLCNNGVLQLLSCPANLHWNKDHCDWPSNSGCKPKKPDTETVLPQPPAVSTGPEKPTTGTLVTTAPDINEIPSYKVVCYFTNWAWYRLGEGKYRPEDIEDRLCTHIIYAFAVLDSTTLQITPHDVWADIDNDFYGKVTSLRASGKKVLIAIGGWNDSLGDKYSRLVNDAAARAKFVKNVVKFIEKWRFDGLDLDWEYPKCWQVDCNAGPASDKQGFTSLIRELREAFAPKNWLLSAAVSASKTVIDAAYDVPAIAKHLDWIAVMTYDYNGHWNGKTGHVAPLYYYPGDQYDYFNANYSMNYWMTKGAPASKLVMGVPMYGQSFTLTDASNYAMNAPSSGPGEAGEYTRSGGFLAYYEICYRVKHGGWSVERDSQYRVGPWAKRGTQWVSFDDTNMVLKKMELIQKMGFGGAMTWAIDLDDFLNRCGCGKYPLLKAINAGLKNQSPPTCDL